MTCRLHLDRAALSLSHTGDGINNNNNNREARGLVCSVRLGEEPTDGQRIPYQVMLRRSRKQHTSSHRYFGQAHGSWLPGCGSTLETNPPSLSLSLSVHPALVSANDLHDCTGILPCQRNGHVAEDQGLPPTAAVPLPRPPNFRSCAARSIVGTATSTGVQVAETIRTERALRQSLLSQQPWRRSLSSMAVSAEYPSQRRLFHGRLLESPGGTLGLSHPSNTTGPTSHGARKRGPVTRARSSFQDPSSPVS